MYDLEEFKKVISVGDIIVNKNLFKTFSVPNSTNSKNAFFKELERVFEIEKKKVTTRIISQREDVLKKEHKNSEIRKGKESNNKGKYKLNTGNLYFLYTNLIMSVLRRDSEEEKKKIIGVETTISKLGKNFFNIDRSKRNYVEIYKSQYFRTSILWLEKTGHITINRTYKAKVCNYRVDIETGELVFDDNTSNFIIVEEEEYKKYISCSKKIFEEYFQDKYKTRSAFELSATSEDLLLNRSMMNNGMMNITSGLKQYGLKENDFLNLVFESCEIFFNDNQGDFKFDYVFENNYMNVIDKMAFIMYNKNDLIMYQERYINCLVYRGKLSKEIVENKCKVLADYVSLNEEVFDIYTEEERKNIEKLILPKRISYK